MPVLINHSARLIVSLRVHGKPVPSWLPGENPLDKDYWREVEKSAFIRGLMSGPKPMISVDMAREYKAEPAEPKGKPKAKAKEKPKD